MNMPDSLRVASFNVENLFGRARVFNFYDHSVGDKILEKISEFNKLVKKTNYTSSDKKRILKLYQEELKKYIEVREDRGKFFKKRGWSIIGVKANGSGDWDGAIEFRKAKFSDVARENTARVIKDVNADVACIVEVETRQVLKSFDSHLLKSQYKYEILIDANDPRGIDVGLYSKYPLGGIWTHMFDKKDGKTVFSRDCLEVEVILPDNQPLYILCNHFKSRGYDYDGTASEKRKRQAEQVAKILGKYNLQKDWVIVAGDLNDNPDSTSLQQLLSVQNLFDVLKLQFSSHPMKRWTYYYNNFEQIDFVLVSKPLKDRFRGAGVERRGIYNLRKLTTSSHGLVDVEREYSKVTHWTNAASDHGAVWAEFDL
jgi:endonuclease/exonuclease/phosphatase family metal-dependent hydrolase